MAIAWQKSQRLDWLDWQRWLELGEGWQDCITGKEDDGRLNINCTHFCWTHQVITAINYNFSNCFQDAIDVTKSCDYFYKRYWVPSKFPFNV